MSQLQFNASGDVFFDSKYDGSVRLNRQTWEQHITSRPERAHLKFNTHKIATTLVVPDYVRESRSDGPNVHLYYKEFSIWKRSQDVELPIPSGWKYFVIVVHTQKKLILTMYETEVPKKGKEVT